MSKKKKNNNDHDISVNAWGDFLYHRARVIQWLLSDGKYPAQIAQILSMDPEQVLLISMTSLDSIAVHQSKAK